MTQLSGDSGHRDLAAPRQLMTHSGHSHRADCSHLRYIGPMAEIPSTHYVKSDDVHIAYQVLGEGSFDLLFVPGFVSNVEATWQSPEQSAFFRRLASFCRLILFDKRGTGMSDRGSQMFVLEQRMHDVQAILDEVGAPNPDLKTDLLYRKAE
jgi:hypothetical protein